MLQRLKNIIPKVYDGVKKILKENNKPQKLIEVKIALFRNYNDRNKLLEVSDWESNPKNLTKYLEKK
jgi:hypothetical protein